MAFSLTFKRLWCFAIVLISITTLSHAEQSPAQIVAKALLCFNERMIYESCQEAYQLNESGNINVPSEAADEYCNGPCYSETELVLNCVDGILSNFVFYNKATVQDVRSVINAGCSDTSERGNFDVASHIQGVHSHAHKHVHPIYMYMVMAIGGGYLL
ncbi:uncharacterized protein LOC131225277 [Magnolia sinica]|uniref:uncharacterized protein LOC131225277 n=1 Tax=Magnolia sinica TaxID=86752 RepID=UPI0026582CEB|nr:uncharacterized protein LOC131225277 [Magnolia sinica]